MCVRDRYSVSERHGVSVSVSQDMVRCVFSSRGDGNHVFDGHVVQMPGLGSHVFVEYGF